MSTLKINVGGTLHEVSRSLLEQYPNTMLSRMASETWQKNPDETLFIERDGQRFRYVLDYMRDGKISLPGGQGQRGITKSSLLDELAYFGFEGVKPGSVQVEFVGFDAPKYIARLTEEFETEKHNITSRRDQLNVELACITVAHACCIRRMGKGCAGVEFNIHEGEPSSRLVFQPRKRNTDTHLDYQVVNAVQETSLTSQPAALNKALEKYGLRMLSYREHTSDFRDEDYSNRTDRRLYKVTMDVYSISD